MYSFKTSIYLSFLGTPTIDGNYTDGRPSPEKPALMALEPLSMTIFFSGIWKKICVLIMMIFTKINL
jgi:hypothetical protein